MPATPTGIAGALLDAALDRLSGSGVRTLDAWTREDEAADRWYQASGFTEQYRYLHVYLGNGDDTAGFATPEGLSTPVRAFMHAPIELEEQMRRRFARVHVCRQYLRRLDV